MWKVKNYNTVLFQDGATPLFKAAHKGHLDVVIELLKKNPALGLLQVSRKIGLYYELYN